MPCRAVPSDERADAGLTDLAAVDVVVVPAVGVADIGSLTRASPPAGNGRYGADQGHELDLEAMSSPWQAHAA